MDECYFVSKYQCKADTGPLIDAGPKRIQTIIGFSKGYGDEIGLDLTARLEQNSALTIKCHKACVSTYTSKLHLKRHVSRSGSNDSSLQAETPKRSKRSDAPTFDFNIQCLFCGEECIIQRGKKNPGRWRASSLCTTADGAFSGNSFKDTILEKCQQRSDTWATDVQGRVSGAISDLHAADARYHRDCMAKFMSPRNVNSAATMTPPGANSCGADVAFNTLVDTMSEDRSRVWNSVELLQIYESHGGSVLSRKQLVRNICNHFGEDLVVLSATGVASIIVFKNDAPGLMKLVKEHDDVDIEGSLNKVAKQIVMEIKELDIDKKHYDIRLNEENIQRSVSETLVTLLSKLTTKLNRTSSAYLIGNIVTSTIVNHPMPLQIALGVLLRSSKTLIKQMHEFNVTCSYDEVLRFRKSAAVAAATSTSLDAISETMSGGMVQTIVDNFDADISSQNGKVSTHSLAVLLTQPMNKKSPDKDEIIKRIPLEEMSKTVDYDLHIEHYNGPKKPEMPEKESLKAVLPLKVIASMAISANHAGQTDFSFLHDMTTKDTCPEYNGYNTRDCRTQGQSCGDKTKSVYLPLIDMTPASPDTIMTALRNAQTLTAQHGQNFVVFTGDLQLYRVAVNILWAYPEQFSNVVLRLGGMHTLMSFVGCVGNLLSESGLREVMETTFGGVNKMLIGKKFPQNVRALRIVAEELLRPLFNERNIGSMNDLQCVLEEFALASRTSRLWIDSLIRPVFIMMMYVRAERVGDWPLHLYAIRSMMPYFFAAGHINYARYGLYYLRSMESMPKEVLDKFMKGEHVMRHNPGIWNGIWSDMFIETTFMRYGHGKGGIIGITLKPETLKVWALSLHICSKLEEDLCNATEINERSTHDTHKEEMKSRIKSDLADRESIRKKLEICIDPLDKTQHSTEIVNIVTGKLAPASVNVDKAVEIGRQQMISFETKWPTSFNETITQKVVTQAVSKKHVKVGDSKVYDTNVIYSRVIGIQASTREVDIKNILSHELAPIPTSMFTDSGDMRICKSKSVLKKLLQQEIPTRHTSNDITCTVIDGSAILYVVHWPVNGTVADYVHNVKAYVERKLKAGDVYLVFDRYQQFSIKSVTRSSREKEASRVHKLSLTMKLPPQNVVLTVTENKKQLVAIICKEILTDTTFQELHTQTHKLVITGEDSTPVEVNDGVVIRRHDMKTTHEEADNIIAHQMIVCAEENQHGIAVISDDTDVFLLLLHYYLTQHMSSLVIMESPVRDRVVTDIGATVEHHKNIVPDLLAAHALSGCDTVASYVGIGKGTVLKRLKAGLSLNKLGDPKANMDSVLEQCTRFVCACYGAPAAVSMSDARQRTWAKKFGKSSTSTPKLMSLPPTSESFKENVRRAHLQTCIWKHALETDPPDLDPLQYGWMLDESAISLIPTMVPANTALAPAEVLKLIKCSCGSDTPCASMKCKCSHARLSCTIFCGCQGGSACCNPQTHVAS